MEKIKNGFIAKRVVFNEADGYMVTQYQDGEVVIEQFVREEEYAEFVLWIGELPIVIE